MLDAAAAELGDARTVRRRRHPRAGRRASGSSTRALERHGRLDVLVNNAGGQYFVPAEAIDAEGLARPCMRLNVGGTSR